MVTAAGVSVPPRVGYGPHEPSVDEPFSAKAAHISLYIILYHIIFITVLLIILLDKCMYILILLLYVYVIL